MSATNGDGRLTDGRFAPGNKLARGNPQHRRMAELRAAALEEATPERVRAMVRKLMALALGGDVPAARLALEYTLGKPPQALELSGPDGGPLGADWEAVRTAILTALDGFPEAKLAVALSLRRIAAEARRESEEEGG